MGIGSLAERGERTMAVAGEAVRHVGEKGEKVAEKLGGAAVVLSQAGSEAFGKIAPAAAEVSGVGANMLGTVCDTAQHVAHDACLATNALGTSVTKGVFRAANAIVDGHYNAKQMRLYQDTQKVATKCDAATSVINEGGRAFKSYYDKKLKEKQCELVAHQEKTRLETEKKLNNIVTETSVVLAKLDQQVNEAAIDADTKRKQHEAELDIIGKRTETEALKKARMAAEQRERVQLARQMALEEQRLQNEQNERALRERRNRNLLFTGVAFAGAGLAAASMRKTAVQQVIRQQSANRALTLGATGAALASVGMMMARTSQSSTKPERTRSQTSAAGKATVPVAVVVGLVYALF